MATAMSTRENDNQMMTRAWRPWIPSIDDLWDAYEKVKTNYTNGIFKGTTATLIDVLSFVSTWQVWRLPFIHKWLLCMVSIVLLGVRKLEDFYIRGCQKLPPWLRSKIERLRISVHLHKAEDVLEHILEKLENLPSNSTVEVDNIRSWIPAIPSSTDLKSASGRIKSNFTQGSIFNGIKLTCNDTVSVLAAWNFWKSSIGQFLLGFSLTLVEEGVLAILKFYQWVSIYLSVIVYLTRLADSIHNFRDQVAPAAQLDNGHAALLAQEDERSEEDLTQNNSTATAQHIQ